MNLKPVVVSYLRVSTPRQGATGLGIEAQRAAVQSFIEACSGEHLAEFVEVETGKGANALTRRPMLGQALALARSQRATLVIAKLDRLARNVRFVSELMESGVRFAACDMPEANPFVLHVMAAVAEHEATAISSRTKAALAAAKLRGVQLGRMGPSNIAPTNAERALRAASRAEALRDHLERLVAEDRSLQSIGDSLRELGHAPPGGGAWHRCQVSRLLQRLRAPT